MKNSRFATVLHIISLLATNRSKWISSEWIAQSIGINAVIVRRELIALSKKGWIETKKGKYGGVRLIVDNQQITLADIYNFIEPGNVMGIFNKATNPHCPIGKRINTRLDYLSKTVNNAVNQVLKQQSLQDFISKFE